jgi:putative flippase GtrA
MLYHPKFGRIIRYVISGGIGTVTNFGLIYLFTDYFGIWYLKSSIIAFIISVIISFICQKYLTFQNTNTEKVHKQMVLFIILALINLGINTLLMYLFVDIVGMWYLSAQVVTSALIAISSFFVYKHVIFTHAAQ